MNKMMFLFDLVRSRFNDYFGDIRITKEHSGLRAFFTPVNYVLALRNKYYSTITSTTIGLCYKPIFLNSVYLS